MLLDAGDLFGGAGHPAAASTLQQRIAAETLVEGMSLLGYDALGMGEGEQTFGSGFLRQIAAAASFPVVSSSVTRRDEQEPLLGVEVALLDAGPLRLGVASVLDQSFADWVAGHEDPDEPLSVRPTVEALQRALDALDEQGADLRVLLAHVPEADLAELITAVPGFEIVIGGHDTMTPFTEPRMIAGSAVVQTGWEGKRIGRLDVRVEPDGRLVFEGNRDVVLDGTFPDDPEMVALHERYLERVATAIDDILAQHPAVPPPTGTRYVGNGSCTACHEHDDEAEAYRVTDHTRAFQTLVLRSRDYDPECYACHTTGFGYEGGFRLPDKTPGMKHVGCESCHGAGADHEADPTLPYGLPVTEDRCRSCHTPVHSPDFDDAVYRPQVRCDR